jgi:tetratricopeptide (TPR) repeat protein
MGRVFQWLATRRVRLLLAAVALLLLAAGGWYGGRHALAWRRLDAARRALAADRPQQARQPLEYCLKVWPNDASIELLAARAARRSGDLEDAQRHLLACQRLERDVSEDSVLEFALLRAAGGEVDEVDPFLQLAAQRRPEQKPMILEALCVGFLRLYRVNEALGCLEQWLRIEPNSVAAIVLRGKAWKRLHAYHNAVADFERALELDPEQFDSRLDLASIHIENGNAAEAITHLEYLRKREPDNREVLIRLAAALTDLGEYDASQKVLDELLHDHPDFAPALSVQGQLCLVTNRFAEAETWLRRAMAENPFDRQSHYRLYMALQRQHKDQEAAEQEKRLKQIDGKIERLIELSNLRIPRNPHDPALLVELGQIICDLGQEDVGFQWYLTALKKNANFAPAHRALGDYYERKGNLDEATYHRRMAALNSTAQTAGPK